MVFGFGKKKIFSNLNSGLKRTRHVMLGGMADMFLGKKQIDGAVLEELETHLLMADVGVAVTQEVVAALTKQVARKELTDTDALLLSLKKHLKSMLLSCSVPLDVDGKYPYVILFVGVNGSGKTTTIGKLAQKLQRQGKTVMLAAGDTFRAAATEQLQAWGERNDVIVIAQQAGADSAAVIYDAMQAAKARRVDVLLADTAGRLHTQTNLMAELQKVKRVIGKGDDTAPHEVMLVLDAGVGQNALQQAKQFNDAVTISGITLTKLDGTAKGGIIFAIAQSLMIPIRYIGVGESVEDLRAFDAGEFVDALFTHENSQ